jgi:simple sugar transport system substrate-binding protein
LVGSTVAVQEQVRSALIAKEESMRRMATLAVAGVAAICAVVGPSVSYAADQLRFVMVSHIGSNDPNMGWLTTSLKAFEQKYPDVKTE